MGAFTAVVELPEVDDDEPLLELVLPDDEPAVLPELLDEDEEVVGSLSLEHAMTPTNANT